MKTGMEMRNGEDDGFLEMTKEMWGDDDDDFFDYDHGRVHHAPPLHRRYREDPSRSIPADVTVGRIPGPAPSRVIGGAQLSNEPVSAGIPERPRKITPEAVAGASILVGIGAAILAVALLFG